MIVLLPSSVAARIVSYGDSWGYIGLRTDTSDGVFVVYRASSRQAVSVPENSAWLNEHYSRWQPLFPNSAFWMTADSGLAAEGLHRLVRGGTLDFETELRPRLHHWQRPANSPSYFLLTHAGNGEEWAGWWIVGGSGAFHDVIHVPVVLVDEQAPLLAPLEVAWPLHELDRHRVLLVGAGSIGSAAAEALASYAIRHIDIVDPEHLQPHNFARHRLHRRVVGRLKAPALRDHLLERDPALEVAAYPLNVVDSADRVRDLVRDASIVVVASDGVASRRAMNLIACWADTPVVFACVLENGAYGEIIRVRPHRTGCLECDRETLYESGQLDPEPGLERGYLEGGGAQPMTAVGGDLHLVGQLAAKVAVAALLEGHGDRSQALPGDVLLVGLRPVPELEAPFDFERLLEVRWRDLPAPRPTCPVCGDG